MLTFGASSGATPGTSVPGFEVLSSPVVPNAFSSNGLTGGPGLLSLEGPHRLKSVDEASSGSQVRKTNTPFFRMQRDASLNPCDSLSHRSHTSTLAWQSTRPAPIEDHHVAFVNHWNVTRLEMSLPLCCSARTFNVKSSKNCRSFRIQGPRIVVLSLSLLMVPDQHLVIRLGSQQILLHRSRRRFIGIDLACHLFPQVGCRWICC